MSCSACKQFGGAMPLSYVNPVYREPSAFAGSDRVFSEPGLARPVLNLTGGKRRHTKSTKSRRSKSTKSRRSKSTKSRRSKSTKSRRNRRTRKHGGFYPSVMGGLISSGPKLVPVAAVTGYKMFKNYKIHSK